MRVSHADHGSPHVLLVTSPGRREGKTLTAANLALAMARDHQRRICIVDADLRYPRLHKLFGLPDGPGLADVLTGRSTMPDALTLIEDQQVTLLPAGRTSAHPGNCSASQNARSYRHAALALRRRRRRLTVRGSLADLGILAPLADRVVLVVRAGQTTKPAIHGSGRRHWRRAPARHRAQRLGGLT
jgi:Mrp family chromosome partitioning ATPase